MAYPDSLPLTGKLENTGEILEYFIGALLDSDINPEKWPMFIPDEAVKQYFLDTAPTLPMTRGQFYTWINNYSTNPTGGFGENYFGVISGSYLYTYTDIQSDWPIKAVNDWAKIKCLEIGIFGDLGNGSDTSKSSIIGSGSLRSRLPFMRINSLYLLRNALIYFPDYGMCHSFKGPQATPPSNIQMSLNPSSRSFSFNYAPGYTNPTMYEYEINGREWLDVESNPQLIDDIYGAIPVGGLQLRNKGSSVYESRSITISNTQPLSILGVSNYLSIYRPTSACSTSGESSREIYVLDSDYNRLSIVPENSAAITDIWFYKDAELKIPVDDGWYHGLDGNKSYNAVGGMIQQYTICSSGPTMGNLYLTFELDVNNNRTLRAFIDTVSSTPITISGRIDLDPHLATPDGAYFSITIPAGLYEGTDPNFNLTMEPGFQYYWQNIPTNVQGYTVHTQPIF